MSRLPIRLALACVLVLLFSIGSIGPIRAATSDPDVWVPRAARVPAPAFSLADANGRTRTLAGYRGRVLLLDFWATWCTGCKTEIPWYVEFQKKYGSRGLASLGVAMDDEGWRVVRLFLHDHPMSYPIVASTPEIVREYEVENLPVTLLIDRHGAIADSHLGVVDKASWEQHIRALLDEK